MSDYHQLKTKSSMNLIPDKSSLLERLKRSNLQTYIQKQCTEQNIIMPVLTANRLGGTRRWNNTCLVFDITVATMTV